MSRLGQGLFFSLCAYLSERGLDTVTDRSLTKTIALPVKALRPNAYNPNQLTKSEFSELVAEIRHLGKLPKPVVVRSKLKGKEYVIVDGEHGWRAAQQIGLEVVDCEVIEVDDFEAMRQTYKRNQHGSHDPVRLGQMFTRMLDARGISGRQLAREIGVSEGTIRNSVNYARAAGLRSDYAFDQLTQDEIRTYLKLPQPINDLWLDSGARPNSLKQALSVTLGKSGSKRGWKLGESTQDGIDFFTFIADGGLWKTIDAKDFVATTQRAFRFDGVAI
jgi:ParB/RepB/Spo0J family partition protein